MKKYKLLAAMVLVTAGTVAQEVSKRGTFRLKKSEHLLAVNLDKMNVLYRGLDNPLSIAISGLPPSSYVVEAINARIEAKSNSEYSLYPGQENITKLVVRPVIGGKEKYADTAYFRVKNVPNPVALFAGVGGGAVPKPQILAATGVEANMENFLYDLNFNIVSFQMSATVKGNVITLESRNSNVTSDMNKLLNNLVSGQKLYIENIKAKGPDGSVRHLGTIAILVI